MIKGMMGPEHGAKATFGSAKAADTRRKKTGSIKTAKLPTSLDELEQTLPKDEAPNEISPAQRLAR